MVFAQLGLLPTAWPRRTTTTMLHGRWRKDYKASDMSSLHRAMKAMHLSRFDSAAAIRVLKGLEICSWEDGVHVGYLTTVPFYKPVERFRPHEETTNARRDRRSGPARCKLVRTGADGMEVELIWDGEYPGIIREEFTIRPDGRLEVKGRLSVEGRDLIVTQVYERYP
ncbi:hypothetical protein ACKKBG_A05150 [Auxenochlorella protothecoides x Auxenochlorella symbiontica]|nr:hypothetical protein F751_0640 [Auxenochlorella protothecoides]KFM27954.1 hypothetical protein F751_0640 [Auxenochlorella protothecoides]RMZ54059.1 hypothetical protein APUTEX25_002636 [Auxenochlorella protothecoides]|eukprot:RMZ54059.1 hypothetical protein APUTEX25_002636 [Auxenochlorella protothecoides]